MVDGKSLLFLDPWHELSPFAKVLRIKCFREAGNLAGWGDSCMHDCFKSQDGMGGFHRLCGV